MKIIKQKIYEGINIYSHKKCIRIDVDLCGYAEIPSKDIPNFNQELVEMIPELKSHRCGIDEEGGFVKRLKEGTYLAHICEHIIIAIQNKLGIEVAYGKAREIKDDLYYIIFQYEYKTVAIETARLAIDIINSLINEQKISYEDRIKILEEILSKEITGPSTQAIKLAANRLGLPTMQLSDSGFFQIGYGKQGRVIEATIGSNSSCVAVDIASDKLLTKELLKSQNIPVAEGNKVTNIINLLKEGEVLGYPLVLKPRFGCKGDGVILNISCEKELIEAYNSIKDKYPDLIIEKNIEGNDYRVCVVGNKVIAVSLRIPPFIICDGIHDIKFLIRKVNEDSKRGFDHEKPLTKIKIDEKLLKTVKKQGYSLSSIPPEGKKITLRYNANLSTGGEAIDYTELISEENKEICIRAAKIIGLDICGIDIKTKDISQSLNSNGVIIEVNAAPGIRMHEHPSVGISRKVGEAILRLQYKGEPCNIPVISVTGTNGKTTTTRLISHVLSTMGYKVGMTSTEGIFIGGKCIDKGDDTGYLSARTILFNKEVEVAVLETARGGIIKKGLAYENADVAVITNITEDHLGLDGINTMEELAFVKSLVGEAVKASGYAVINCDDKWSKKIIPRIKVNKIFFSKNKENPLLINEINNGGIAVFVEGENIYVINDNKKYHIINIENMPLTFGGILEFNIENALASCAALVGIGIDYCMISKGFKTFQINEQYNPGRFNMYDYNGVNVILDYGHNIEGYKAIFKAIDKIKSNKVIGVIGVPGDRENENMVKIGELCGEFLDSIIIKEDKDRRGRLEGETANLIKEGILKTSNNKNALIILDEIDAFNEAIKLSKEGDIIIVFYEDFNSLLEIIKGNQKDKGINEKNLNVANN
ncbi:MAG: cyanophycin synthetase [Clostridiales bacterium]|nr:cyanophycin synthetase [Clostridiales bacterium]